MAKFKKGDRVRVVFDDFVDNEVGIQWGDTGTVMDEDIKPYVRMDKYNKNFTDLEGLCEDGHGWFFDESQLELIEEEKPTAPTLTTQELYYLHGVVSTLPDETRGLLLKVLDKVVIDDNL